jgi:hypothetical protein
MGLVTESMSGLAVNNAAKTKEVDQEKLRLKKEQRKQRREEERRQLGEERVEDFNVDVPLPPLLIVMRRANATHTHTRSHTHTGDGGICAGQQVPGAAAYGDGEREGQRRAVPLQL